MPISRYQIRNEYNLADPELYTAADRDDPEAILEGVAMAGLVGVLRQLGDLAEFAAEIFHDLHEEVMATSARGHGLMLRVQQLEEEFPSLGKAFLSQTSQLHFTSNAGTDWHANLQMDQNLVTRGDLPRFIMDSYEECRGPPRLFLLDKFDIAGAGACLKRYTDPSFFKTKFVSSLSVKADIQKEKKARKAKKKGPRWKNGETPEAFSASDFCSKLRQVASDEPSRVSGKIPIRGVLKRKNLNVSSFCSKNGRSYMEQFHEILSLQHGSVSENSFTHSSMKRRSSDSSEMFSEIHEIVPKDSVIKPMQKEHTLDILKSPIGELGPEIVKQGPVDCLLKPINEPSDGKDSTFLDYVPKNVGIDGDKSDDNISELENYVDALTTVESEIEMDSETRSKHVRGFFSLPNQVLHPNTKTDEQLELHPHLSDSSSVRSSSASYDWNGLLQKGKSSRSNSDSIGNMEEAFPPSKICRVEPHDISSEKISKDEDTFKSKSPVRLLPSSASSEFFEVPDTVSQAEVSFASCITDSTSNIGQFSSNKPEQAEISSSYGEACTVESSPNIKAIDQMLFGVLPGTPSRSELPSETKDMKNISGFDLDFPAKLSPMEETSSNNNSIGEAAEDRNTDLPSKVEDDTVHLKVTGILSETPVISGPPMETEEQEPSTFDVGFSEKSVEDSLFEESLIGKTAEVYKSDQSSEAEVDTMHEKSTVGDMETNLSPESSLSWLPLSHNLMAEINEERIQRSVMKEPYALSDRSTSPQEYFPVSAPSELTVGFGGLGMAGESNLRGGDVKYLTTNSVEMSDALESDMKKLSMTKGTDLNFMNMMENPSCPMDSSPGSAPVEVHEQSDVLEAKAVSLEANANDCASNLIVSPRRSVVEVDERFDDLVTRDTIEESGTESFGAKVIPSKASFIELHKMPDGLITSGTPDEACTVNVSDEHGLNLNQVKDPEACEPNLIVSLDAQKVSDDLVTGDALIETDTDDGVLNRVKDPEACGPNVSVSLQAPFTDLQKEVTGDTPTEADTSDCRSNMVQFQEDSGDHAELLECPTEIISDQRHLEINMEDRGSDTQTIPSRANEVDQPVLGSADLNSDLLNPDSDSEFIDSIHPSPVEDAKIKWNPTDGSEVSCSEADQESELDFLPYEHSSSTVKDLSEQDVRNLQTEVESSVGFSHEEVESPKSPKKINKKSEPVSPPLSPRDCFSEAESSAICFVPEPACASEQVTHEHSPQASLEALHEEGVVPCLSKEINQISESKLLHETHCDSVGVGISLPTEFLLEPATALDQVLEEGENPKSSYLQHETAQSLIQTDHEPSEPPVPLDSCFATNKDMTNGLYASSITMVVSEAFTSAPCHNFKNSEPGVSLSTSISPSFGLPILETDKQLSSNVEEMPPLPPLPPLQWRMGKLHDGSNTLGEEMSEPRNLCTPFSATEDKKTLQGFKFFGGQNFHPTNPFGPLPTFTSADLAGPPSNPFVSVTVEGDNQNVFLGLDGQMFYPSNPFARLEAEKPQNSSLTFGGEAESLQSAFVVPPSIEAEMKPHQSSMTTEEDVGPPTIPLEVLPSEEDKLDRPRRKDPLIEAVAAHDRSMLRKVSERIRPEIKPKVDERDSLLEQIRAKSFNLKPAVATRPIVHGPKTNLNVVAILEKAHAIRQALAGSDEDDDADSWSDS